MKRMESRKSHSWWWNSHISPKNSKWLQENLEEMDQHVKRMLKLIEEDADSFAKKAEMYYQKRPELISLVEEFHRMYRSLAERYDHMTVELRKNIPLDLQSQSSGISDVGSEPPSNLPSPRTTTITMTRPRGKSGPRGQAGFDFFLGSSGNGYGKEGDESSTLDSEGEESDDSSSVNNYSGGGPHNNNDEEHQGLRRRIIELEVELRDVKEKLVRVQEEEISEGFFRKSGNGNIYGEEELHDAKDEIQLSEDVHYLNESPETVVLDKIEALKEELRITREKVHESENEIASLRQEIANKVSTIETLQDQLKYAGDELSLWKNNLEEENDRLQEEIARISTERNYIADSLKELDLRRQSFESTKEETESTLGSRVEQLKAEIVDLNASIDSKDDQIDQMNDHLQQLHMEHVEMITGAEAARKLAEELRARIHELEREVKRKEAIIVEGAEEKREAIRQLCFSLEHYRNGYYRLREVVMSHKRTPVVMAT